MLDGIDPILIFNISKTIKPTAITQGPLLSAQNPIPVAESTLQKLGLPAIPIYLSESISGLYIDTEDKSIEVETSVETTQSASDPVTNQRLLNNTVKINLMASKDSVGLTMLSALMDFVVPLVTSKDITIHYFHGAIAVFNGLLHSFNINQQGNSTLHTVSLEIVKVGIKKSPLPEVSNKVGEAVLKSGTKVGS